MKTKEEKIRSYLEELDIHGNELSELTDKLIEQEESIYDYEENFFAGIEEKLASEDDPTQLTGDLYEKPDYLGECYLYVVLSKKGWPLHFGWTMHPDSIEIDVLHQAKDIIEVKVSQEGYTEEIANNWVDEQVKTFKRSHSYKPYLQDKILA